MSNNHAQSQLIQWCVSIFAIITTPLVVTAFMIVVWSHGVWTARGAPPGLQVPHFSYADALVDTTDRFVTMIRNCGALGVFIVATNYLGRFGILIAMTWILGRIWNAKRVLAFWLTAVSVTLAFSYPYVLRASPSILWYRYQTSSVVDHWTWHILAYPWYVVPLSLLAGWGVARLPMLRPGKRFWLKRGMCPKCQYILGTRIESGCPECGWHRKAITQG